LATFLPATACLLQLTKAEQQSEIHQSGQAALAAKGISTPPMVRFTSYQHMRVPKQLRKVFMYFIITNYFRMVAAAI
jgi:hypothetical protein